MNKYCLLLTATITPQSVPNLKRINPLEREQDYLDALKKWVKIGIPIVFCENSNTHSDIIDAFLKESQISFEYLTFQTLYSSLGKSSGEAEIINHALVNSVLLNKSEYIIKVTGRYFVSNFIEQIEQIAQINQSSDCMVFANIHDYLRYADSRFFIGNQLFWKKYLTDKMKLIDEKNNIYMEHSVARAIHLAMSDGNNWALLPCFPIYEGVYGTLNSEYNLTFYQKSRDKLLYGLKKRLIKKVLI
jgi:hypothetical protein